MPRWSMAHFPGVPQAGNFESKIFDPDHWRNNYPNPAFRNRLPDDEFWAAKHVMRFTDEEIRAPLADAVEALAGAVRERERVKAVA